eukprot:4381265-Pleurochrysis_carterae.AAC.2
MALCLQPGRARPFSSTQSMQSGGRLCPTVSCTQLVESVRLALRESVRLRALDALQKSAQAGL